MDETSIIKLKSSLETTNWDNILNYSDVNVCYNAFIQTFLENMDIHCPVTDKKSDCRKRVDKPWLTTALKKSCKKKNSLYKTFLNNKN